MNREGNFSSSLVGFKNPAFIFGIIFLFFTILLAIYAFRMTILTKHQVVILSWALSVCAGITAGSFIGSLKVVVKTKRTMISSLGGFSVWLITFMAFNNIWSAPEEQISVSFFAFLNENNFKVERTGSNTSPTVSALETRSNNTFYIKKINDLRIAFIMIIKGFDIKRGGKIKVLPKFSILNDEMKPLAVNTVDTYETIFEWKSRPLIKSAGHEVVINYLKLSPSDLQTSFPMIVLLEGFKSEDEIPKGNGYLRITLTDKHNKISPLSLFQNENKSDKFLKIHDNHAIEVEWE